MLIILIIIILVVSITSFWYLNILYKRTNHYQNRLVTIRDYLEGVPNDLKLVTFGSTYSKYAFNTFKENNLNAFNFSVDAECLECDFEILKQYESHLSPDAVVAFSLAACVACCKEEVVVLNPLNYMHIMDDLHISRALKTRKNWVKFRFPLLGKSLKNVKYLIADVAPISDVVQKIKPAYTAEQRNAAMKGMADGWIRLFKLVNLRDIDFTDEMQNRIRKNTETLRSMIEYSKSKGWRPVVVVIPHSALLNSYFSDAFVESSLKRIAVDATKGLNVPFFDYRKHKDYQYNPSMFLDGGFRMSKIGSNHFTRIVLDDLNRIGYNLNNKTLAL